MSDQQRAEQDDIGIERRYDVKKVNDPTGKHAECRYFVLDPQHDPLARVALRTYADEAWNAGNRVLGDELTQWARECESGSDQTAALASVIHRARTSVPLCAAEGRIATAPSGDDRG